MNQEPINNNQQPILQQRVQNYAEQQIWKSNNFNDLEKQVALPNETQEQIKKVIDDSTKQLVQVVGKQKDVIVEKKQVKDEVVQIYKQETFLNIDNLTTDMYNSFSIMDMVADFVYKRIAGLIQIQTQIDPVTLNLVEIKKNKVINIVTDLLKKSDLQYKFSKIIGLYESDVDKVDEMTVFIEQIFKKIYNDCVKIDFAIDQDVYRRAAFNQKIHKNTSRQYVEKMQTQAFNQRHADNQKSDITQTTNDHLNEVFLKLLLKKRKQYRKTKKYAFWQEVDLKKYDVTTIINNEISDQITKISQSGKLQIPSVPLRAKGKAPFWQSEMVDQKDEDIEVEDENEAQ